MSIDGERRRAALLATRLYLVVTPSAAPGWEAATRAALATGTIGVVQLRGKEMDDAAYLRLAARLRALAEGAGALTVLNDRVHLVEAAGADGVHVGEDDVSPTEARGRLGPSLLVGVSTHDEQEVRAARKGPADYAGLGPCFETSTKRLTRPPGGADLVRRSLPEAGSFPVFPVFPIAGITAANLPLLVAAGADRAAVGSAILDAHHPGEAARALDRILRGAPSR